MISLICQFWKKKQNKTNGHKKIETVIDTENEQVVASRERVLEERNRWGILRDTNAHLLYKWSMSMKCTVWGTESIVT